MNNLGWSVSNVLKGKERETCVSWKIKDQCYQVSVYTHRKDVPGAFNKDDQEGRMINGHTMGDEISADKHQTPTQKSWPIHRRPEF